MARLSRADELRQHREVFLYAREHNLTLPAAAKALAWERAQAAQARLDLVKRCGRAATSAAPIGADAPHKPAPENAPWMMRD